MKKIGLIGCGAIGSLIAESVDKGIVKCDGIILYDSDLQTPAKLKKSLHVAVEIVTDVDAMISMRPKVIVEAASQEAARTFVPRILAKNIDVIVMSVGALLGLKMRSARIHFPSGAIGGLDALESASLAGINEITLTTRKNPKALGVNEDKEKVIYKGTPEEAVRLFPREMNVAARLALIAEPEKIKVRVVSDPRATRNIHEINVQWKHGNMFFRFENEPHPDNIRTSALAAWSAIKLLKDLVEEDS